MHIQKYLKFSSLSLIALVIISIAGGALVVKANPTLFPPEQRSAAATTTVTYMAAGVATTTATYDAYATYGNVNGANEISLLTQQAGSSTSSVLIGDVQYSVDGIDWYAAAPPTTASSTVAFGYGAPYQLKMQFASSTISGAAVTNANSATTSRIVTIPTPTRYTRVVFSVPAGSAGSALWWSFQPRKEKAE